MKFGTVVLLGMSAISVVQANDEKAKYEAEYKAKYEAEYKAKYEAEYLKFNGGTWEQRQELAKQCVDVVMSDPSVVKPLDCQKPDPNKGVVRGYIAVTTYRNGNVIEDREIFTDVADLAKYIYVWECVDQQLKNLIVGNSCKAWQYGEFNMYKHTSFEDYIQARELSK